MFFYAESDFKTKLHFNIIHIFEKSATKYKKVYKKLLNWAKQCVIIFRYATFGNIAEDILIKLNGDLFMSKRLYRLFSADISTPALIIGYIFGLFIPLILKDSAFDVTVRDPVSLFITEPDAFIPTLCIQAVYPFIIFLAGFIPCSSLASAPIVFIRSALVSYSSLALSFSGISDAKYILHTICSVLLVTLCWALTRCSDDAKGYPMLYLLKCLFFFGIFFIILFLRDVSLAFM